MHVAREYFFTFAFHLLQFHFLIGRQEGRNLVIGRFEYLGITPDFVAMDRLKAGRGISQDRLNFCLLIRGQVQPFDQMGHPMLPDLLRTRRRHEMGSQPDGERASRNDTHDKNDAQE